VDTTRVHREAPDRRQGADHRHDKSIRRYGTIRPPRVDLAEIRDSLRLAKIDAVVAVSDSPNVRHNAKLDYPAAQRLLERVR